METFKKFFLVVNAFESSIFCCTKDLKDNYIHILLREFGFSCLYLLIRAELIFVYSGKWGFSFYLFASTDCYFFSGFIYWTVSLLTDVVHHISKFDARVLVSVLSALVSWSLSQSVCSCANYHRWYCIGFFFFFFLITSQANWEVITLFVDCSKNFCFLQCVCMKL